VPAPLLNEASYIHVAVAPNGEKVCDFCLRSSREMGSLFASARRCFNEVTLLNELLFSPPLYVAYASGVPSQLVSVEQSLPAISSALACGAVSGVHWRLAATMLRFASVGRCGGIPMVRATVASESSRCPRLRAKRTANEFLEGASRHARQLRSAPTFVVEFAEFVRRHDAPAHACAYWSGYYI
jgi:hypothetical protein